jgi:uncharacterized membrane protein YqgA involved in biofilm formation
MNAFIVKLIATAAGAAIGQILFNKYGDALSKGIDHAVDSVKAKIHEFTE